MKVRSRRSFLKIQLALTALSFVPKYIKAKYVEIKKNVFTKKETVLINTNINGKDYQLNIDTRTTLLDLLRENLHLTGTKKGCDFGQCGACTVHLEGQRVLSCLVLAVTLNREANRKKIITIEGIANEDTLHPMQQAFIECDGFQCGYCTPGQIMSAISCVKEGHTKSVEEIKEFMSGNLCRCGAYNGIVKAIQKVANETI